ncbi:MAG TPA: class I SAM-dependent methyltransferase [Vicinamibacterales bacterium]|nr:class I SAM-dependent methyltransferase [Vicinamibacterales bacterium]
MIGCRVCHSSIEPFIDFGRMPLANGFLSPDQFSEEFFFNLSAAACPRCTLVQLVEQPERERMFNDRYPFFSATSSRMQEHFATLAGNVIAVLPDRHRFVVEIGSNDGTLLRHVLKAEIRHLGFEPSESVAKAAIASGVNTICRFFDAPSAQQILSEQGPAGAIIAANALSHIGDLHSVAEGIAILLAPDGVCVVEDPYWGDVVAKTAFDQIYDEHASYFTLSSLSWLFRQHGLDVVDAIAFDVHGGSIRYVIRRSGAQPPSSRVVQLRDREHALKLHDPGTLARFRDGVMDTGARLMSLLRSCKSDGKRVTGYGATSKSTTTINFFGITPDLLPFICDTTPAKHGTFSPGMHIPVRPHSGFAAPYPERALLFSWNHAAEVRAKEQAFARSGGKWIVYVPAVEES